MANAFAALNKQRTKSTDFRRVEASCLRLVLPEAAEMQELTFQKRTDSVVLPEWIEHSTSPLPRGEQHL
jgi:hypothetical protein